MVILSDGSVSHAGTISELKRSGQLNQILAAEAKEEPEPGLKPQAEEESHENGALTLMKTRSRASEHKIDDGGLDTKGKNLPRKFVDEEKREVRAQFSRWTLSLTFTDWLNQNSYIWRLLEVLWWVALLGASCLNLRWKSCVYTW